MENKSTVLISLAVIILLALGMIVLNSNKEDQSPETEVVIDDQDQNLQDQEEILTPPATFLLDEQTGEYYGSVKVTGTAFISEEPFMGFCEDECPIVSYLKFNVEEADSNAIDALLDNGQRNSDNQAIITLGCITESGFWRSSMFGKADGIQKSENSKEELDLILSSNPLTLELERMQLDQNSGREAPECFTSFDKLSVVTN